MIQMRGVSRHFLTRSGTPFTALEGLSLVIPAGQFVCVLGPSGCGKTTLVNLLAGFLPPTTGEITFGGQPVRSPGPDRGVVFQDGALFPWLSVRENVEFGLRLKGMSRIDRRRLAMDTLEKVGMSASADEFPYTLSGGMRQRVALARVLALSPRALLMDEPFGALDQITRERLQDELLQLQRQARPTVVYVTHSIEEAASLGDRVLVLRPAPQSLAADHLLPSDRPRSRSASETGEVCELLRRELDLLSRTRSSLDGRDDDPESNLHEYGC